VRLIFEVIQCVKGLDKIMETLQITVHIYLLMWCWTTFCLQYGRSPWNGLGISFEESIAEFYTILLEEHLQVALEML
jgi:hypothetical protein